MRAVLTLGLALLTTAPVDAAPQGGDPFAGPPRPSREHAPDRSTGAVYAGDFVLVPHAEEMLLVDSKSGCIWRRTPRSPNDAGYWRFEFPNGYESNCTERLNAARRAAISAGTN